MRIDLESGWSEVRRRSILLTVLCWGLIVALYGYWYVITGIRQPDALTRVPVDPEALALDRIWWIQLLGFAMFRFPILLGALIIALAIEIKLIRRHC